VSAVEWRQECGGSWIGTVAGRHWLAVRVGAGWNLIRPNGGGVVPGFATLNAAKRYVNDPLHERTAAVSRPG
jgi:hypothetical protein